MRLCLRTQNYLLRCLCYVSINGSEHSESGVTLLGAEVFPLFDNAMASDAQSGTRTGVNPVMSLYVRSVKNLHTITILYQRFCVCNKEVHTNATWDESNLHHKLMAWQIRYQNMKDLPQQLFYIKNPTFQRLDPILLSYWLVSIIFKIQISSLLFTLFIKYPNEVLNKTKAWFKMNSVLEGSFPRVNVCIFT